MHAQEIMTENPRCCTPSDSVRAVAKLMADQNCGLIPVVDNPQSMNLVGVITDRDIVCRVVAKENTDCGNASVQQAMTRENLWTVRPNADVDEVIEKMEEGQVRRIPVIDESNKVLGIIAMADLALEIDEPEDIAEVLEEISEPTHSAQM